MSRRLPEIIASACRDDEYHRGLFRMLRDQVSTPLTGVCTGSSRLSHASLGCLNSGLLAVYCLLYSPPTYATCELVRRKTDRQNNGFVQRLTVCLCLGNTHITPLNFCVADSLTGALCPLQLAPRSVAMEDDGFGSFPKFESAPAAAPAAEPQTAPAAERPQTVPTAGRPQTTPAAEQKVRVVGITDAAAQKAAPPAAAAGGSGSSSWGGWGGGWLSTAASAMPQSTAALDSMSSMISVTSMRASANAAAERLTAAMPVTAAAMDAMSPIAAANNLSSLREKVSAALPSVPSAAATKP